MELLRPLNHFHTCLCQLEHCGGRRGDCASRTCALWGMASSPCNGERATERFSAVILPSNFYPRNFTPPEPLPRTFTRASPPVAPVEYSVQQSPRPLRRFAAAPQSHDSPDPHCVARVQSVPHPGLTPIGSAGPPPDGYANFVWPGGGGLASAPAPAKGGFSPTLGRGANSRSCGQALPRHMGGEGSDVP